MIACTKCGQEPPEEKLMPIKNEEDTIYYFCELCLKEAHDLLSLKIIKTPEEKRLLKSIRKFLKHGKN